MSEKFRHEEQLSQLLERFFEELQGMSDQELLSGDSPDALRVRAAARLARATQEAGRRRLAAARIQAVHVRKESTRTVSVLEARNYIARVVQDGHYTLAARQLEEMPESEILRLYEQLRELEDQNSSSDDDPGSAR